MEFTMNERPGHWTSIALITLALLLICGASPAQERVSISYSTLEAQNANFFIAQERRLYQKYSVDADSIFIPSSTTVVTSIIAGAVKVGNGTGGTIANAGVGGANLIVVGCFLNTLPYDLVVQESIKTAEGLKGKPLGIARIGSASDVAARVLLRALGLEPDKDVPIIQVGGSSERAAAFRTGKIAAFTTPPGVIQLVRGIPHRVLISTADFPKTFPFPYACPTTTKSFLAGNRETIRRIMMALIEATHFFKTRKDESKKILAKYARQENESYLEAAYNGNAPMFERVPLVNRVGMEVQIKEALARKPGASMKVEDIVDDSVVVQLEKDGFIDRIFKQ
jgi:NitT/TauT family transport system substrate-binding protein